MRRAVVVLAIVLVATPALALPNIFIGKLGGKTDIDVAIDDRDPKHVFDVSLRPDSEIKPVVPPMSDLRLLTGTVRGAHSADPEFETNHSDGSPIDHARRLHATKILRLLLAAPKKRR